MVEAPCIAVRVVVGGTDQVGRGKLGGSEVSMLCMGGGALKGDTTALPVLGMVDAANAALPLFRLRHVVMMVPSTGVGREGDRGPAPA